MDVEDILREEIRLLQKQLYDETHHTTLVITREIIYFEINPYLYI